MTKGHEVIVTELPQCSFCSNTAAYDGKTVHGPWAFMCVSCWYRFGPGETGVGRGQALKLRAERYVVVCGRCPLCNERTELEVESAELADKINAWRFASADRPYIQDAFPMLTPGQREEILTAIHEKCFDEAFAGEDD